MAILLIQHHSPAPAAVIIRWANLRTCLCRPLIEKVWWLQCSVVLPLFLNLTCLSNDLRLQPLFSLLPFTTDVFVSSCVPELASALYLPFGPPSKTHAPKVLLRTPHRQVLGCYQGLSLPVSTTIFLSLSAHSWEVCITFLMTMAKCLTVLKEGRR